VSSKLRYLKCIGQVDLAPHSVTVGTSLSRGLESSILPAQKGISVTYQLTPAAGNNHPSASASASVLNELPDLFTPRGKTAKTLSTKSIVNQALNRQSRSKLSDRAPKHVRGIGRG